MAIPTPPHADCDDQCAQTKHVIVSLFLYTIQAVKHTPKPPHADCDYQRA